MSQRRSPSAEAIKNNLSDTWLSRLPNEILQLIFQMLPSESLLALEKLEDSRIFDLTCDRSVISTVDFSKCAHLTSLLDFKSFFSSTRTDVITELNFNHCDWIGTKYLLGCIVKCKNLSALSVRDCGFTFPAIAEVLQKAENLLCLEWTVDMANSYRFHISTLGQYSPAKKLQKLRLDFINNTARIVTTCAYFLPHCVSLKELVFYVVVNNVSNLNYHRIVLDPPVHSDMQVSKVLENFIVVFDTQNQSHGNMVTVYHSLRDLSRVILTSNENAQWKSIWIDDSFYESQILGFAYQNDFIHLQNFRSVSCIRVKGPMNYMEILKSVPKNNLHSLCMENIVLSPECFNELAPVVGDKLKRFQLKKCIVLGRLQLSSMLPNLLEKCTSITEINLYGVHTFSGDTPCSALRLLKRLKRVLLMSCHVKRATRPADNVPDYFQGLRKRKRLVPGSQLEVISHPFRDMIESCSFVEELQIIFCGVFPKDSDHRSCEEEDIAPVFLWERLKTLSLHSLENLNNLNCLRKISTQCRHFESLNIHYVGNDSMIPNLCTLFSSSESLSTLRITHSGLHLNRAFWNSLGHAKNLKNLCLVTGFWDRIENSVLVESLSKLKHLQLFHFISSISNAQKLLVSLKNIFGCNSKDQRSELRKIELIIIKKINCHDSASSHHTCVLDIEPFSTGIGNPVKP